MRYAQITSPPPIATRPAALSSACGSLGGSASLEGLSSGRSFCGLSSRRSTGTGLRDMRIGEPTYAVPRAGRPGVTWTLPRSAFGPSSWGNGSICGEPVVFLRAGSYITVINGPPGPVINNVPPARRRSGRRRQGQPGTGVCGQSGFRRNARRWTTWHGGVVWLRSGRTPGWEVAGGHIMSRRGGHCGISPGGAVWTFR